MESDETSKPKQTHFALLLVFSFIAFPVGYSIDQTFRWTNHWEGFLSGLIQGVMLAVPWCLIYVLPWSLIIFGIYRWRRFERFRTQWILAPSLLMVFVIVGLLIFDPPTPANRFESFARTALPADVRDLHYRFTGGGFADYGDTYYFGTSPSEVERLVRDMGLEQNEAYSSGSMSHSGFPPLPGCPDYNTWEGATQFEGWDDRQHWFYYLITDSTRTQVYVIVGCI
tara:strand:- start:9 stop:686 length:678 start_codon:yes stop_codon:yes gene_type:complete